MTDHWVPLEGLETKTGPVVGALVSGAGGVLMSLHWEDASLLPVQAGELIKPPPADGVAPPECAYVIISRRTGQPGRQSYASPIMAQLAVTARPDHEDYQVGVREGEEVRLLSPEERILITEFLTSVHLQERAP